ncbi:MAG: prepilin peptidase [Erysipelotrichaceae bacterium]
MDTLLLTLYFFILGSVIGSFLNVCIYRIPNGKSVSKGFSHCPTCNHQLAAKDLIPIASYLGLGGACRYCKSKISPRYPIIETVTGILFVVGFLVYGPSLALLFHLMLVAVLIVLTMIDFDHMIIPDRLQLILFILGCFAILFFDTNPMHHVLGFFVVSIPLYLVAVLTGGLGGGDVKLMATAGFLLGYQAILVALFIGIMIGGIVGIYLLATKRVGRKTEIPFGPYLAVGIYLASLFGTSLFQWYLGLLF